MIKTAIRAVILVIIVVAGIRYMERKSIFFPMRQMTSTPDDVGLAYEEVYFKTSDDRNIHAWFIPGADRAPTILFSHGNAGNISHRLEKISMMNGMGLNVLIFDYRGYGKSQGSPSEQGLYRDMHAAYEYLVEQRGTLPGDIILYGESIGGAVAIELASRRPVGAIISEAAFSSVKDMARMAFPLIPHFIFSSRFDSLSKIGGISCPKLIIHSVEDEIVPFSQGERLFAAAAEPREFLKLRGGHNTAFSDSRDEYESGISRFIEKVKRENISGQK